MKKILFPFVFLLLVSCSGNSNESSHAALCNDGTYSDSTNCSGTCSSHGGVREWYVQCGSSANSNVASLIIARSSNESIAGDWKGLWINKEDNISGKVSLSITESVIEGLFSCDDNSLNSTLHSHIDENGNLQLFIDTKQTPYDTLIEHPANMSLIHMNNKLIGTIYIQRDDKEEIRELELQKE